MPIYLIDRRAVKAEARALIRSGRVPPLRMAALYLAVNLVLDLIDTAAGRLAGSDFGVLPARFSFLSVFVMLLGVVLSAGFATYCLSIQRGVSMPYESLFDGFSFAGRVILLTVLEALALALGFTLFIIPGVVLALGYSLALFHLCEEPEMGAVEALRRSRTEMRGYKWQLCSLLLSFVPLLLLAGAAINLCDRMMDKVFDDSLAGDLLFTLTTGAFAAAVQVYLAPYLALAQVVFYRRVTGGAPEPEPAAEIMLPREVKPDEPAPPEGEPEPSDDSTDR